MNRLFGLRMLAALIVILITSACSSLTEKESLERQTAVAEKRELWAFKHMACEDSSMGAWMCSVSNERAREQFPWLYCVCVDNQGVLN
jgi:hypothetical protein